MEKEIAGLIQLWAGGIIWTRIDREGRGDPSDHLDHNGAEQADGRLLNRITWFAYPTRSSSRA